MDQTPTVGATGRGEAVGVAVALRLDRAESSFSARQSGSSSWVDSEESSVDSDFFSCVIAAGVAVELDSSGIGAGAATFWIAGVASGPSALLRVSVCYLCFVRPAQITKRRGEGVVQILWKQIAGICHPGISQLRVAMLKCPGRLPIIKRGRLIHHFEFIQCFLRRPVAPLQQHRKENLIADTVAPIVVVACFRK